MSQDPSRRPLPASVQEDVERELRAHVALHYDRLVSNGVEPDIARRQAHAAFGNHHAISRQCRAIATSPSPREAFRSMIESVFFDIRFAWRTLRKNPAFMTTAILTLALGIGANTAIFSVVNGILLRPLPYRDPGRIVAVYERAATGRDNSIARANFVDWQASSTLFDSMALVPDHRFGGRTTVLGGRAPVRVYAGGVSLDFFRTIGVDPVLGRAFAPNEAVEGAPPAIVVGYPLWRDVLGEVPSLDGVTLSVLGTEAQVVGVMPPGFSYPGQTQIWYPAELFPVNPSRTSHGWSAIARLRGDTTLEAAAAEIDAIGAALREQYGEETDAVGVNIYPLKDELVGDARTPLMILLAASGLVLVVACSNLASGLLARGASRVPEIALRAALGAGRQRLIRQMFTEALLLTILGAGAGLATAQFVTRALLNAAPGEVWRYGSVDLDLTVLAFTLLVTVVTALLFGLLPALKLTTAAHGQALRGGSGHAAGDGGGRVWSTLVVVEVGLVVVLLVGAGLLIRSFQAVLDVDTGFEADGVLTVDIELPSVKYPTPEDVGRFFDGVLPELERIPEVERIGIVNHLPLGGSVINGAFNVEGREPHAGYADYRVASADYFAAMGIAIVEGRGFLDPDDVSAEPVVVINEALARDLYGDESAIGKRVGGLSNDDWIYGAEWMRIVGVVADVRHRALTRPAPNEVYVHYRQRPFRARTAAIVLRTAGAPQNLVAQVRERLQNADPDIPAQYTPMTDMLSASVNDRRFTVMVLATFSGLALVLAAVGIYGVVSYAVARRTRDIGIRLALGAEPRRVCREVIRAALMPVGIGLALGTMGALGLGRALASLLFEITSTDPTTFVVVAFLLLATAFAACWLPARRSSRIDPILTMRGE